MTTVKTIELPDCYKRADWSLIPDYMQDGLKFYVEYGIPPGGFMTFLLENKFMEACRKADETNSQNLYKYAIFFDSYLPRDCYGSATKVDKWIEKGGLAGH